MVKDYTKECWYCHGGDIVPDSRGVRCCTCGATWNPVPRTGDTSEAGQALSAPTMVPREDKLSQRGHKAARTRKGNPA